MPYAHCITLFQVVNKDAYLAYLKRNAAGEDAVAKAWPSGDELLNLKHYERHSGILRRTGTRLSLTCRLVPRVHKNLLRL